MWQGVGLSVLGCGIYRDGNDLGEPEYGTLTWATLAALKLAANKVLFQADRKKLFLQTLVLLITGNAAKHTDPAILMGILTIVRSWLLHPAYHIAAPNKAPEAISLTEKVRGHPISNHAASSHVLTSYSGLCICN